MSKAKRKIQTKKKIAAREIANLIVNIDVLTEDYEYHFKKRIKI